MIFEALLCIRRHSRGRSLAGILFVTLSRKCFVFLLIAVCAAPSAFCQEQSTDPGSTLPTPTPIEELNERHRAMMRRLQPPGLGTTGFKMPGMKPDDVNRLFDRTYVERFPTEHIRFAGLQMGKSTIADLNSALGIKLPLETFDTRQPRSVCVHISGKPEFWLLAVFTPSATPEYRRLMRIRITFDKNSIDADCTHTSSAKIPPETDGGFGLGLPQEQLARLFVPKPRVSTNELEWRYEVWEQCPGIPRTPNKDGDDEGSTDYNSLLARAELTYGSVASIELFHNGSKDPCSSTE